MHFDGASAVKKEQIVIVICVLMAMVQFKKEQITQNEGDITQKDNVTVLPGGVTIKKIDDDEEYDIRKEK